MHLCLPWRRTAPRREDPRGCDCGHGGSIRGTRALRCVSKTDRNRAPSLHTRNGEPDVWRGHGVALLCGISTPSLATQGEQRRSAYFNINRDNSLISSAASQTRLKLMNPLMQPLQKLGIFRCLGNNILADRLHGGFVSHASAPRRIIRSTHLLRMEPNLSPHRAESDFRAYQGGSSSR
jgi:hypothetical protein